MKGLLRSKGIDHDLGFNSPVICMVYKRLYIYRKEWGNFEDVMSLTRRLDVYSRELRGCNSTYKRLVYLPATPNQSSRLLLTL